MTRSDSAPSTVGVYGGGRMGAGIAHAFLLAGATVWIVEISDGAVRSAVSGWRGAWRTPSNVGSSPRPRPSSSRD